MGALRCVDGSVLSVQAVTCRDRAGQAYEMTLRLARNSVPFAVVGQRCGFQLSELAKQISAAREDPEQATAWPDPDDRFPPASEVAGADADESEAAGEGTAGGAGDSVDAAGAAAEARVSAGACSMPGDHEYFTLRSRDRDDLPGTGELRCVLRSSAVWVGECMGTGPHSRRGSAGQQAAPGQETHAGPAAGPVPGSARQAPQAGVPRQRPSAGRPAASGHGKWRLTRRAVIEAWGASGVGVRAVLTSAELMAFLDTVLTEPDGDVRTDRVTAMETRQS